MFDEEAWPVFIPSWKHEHMCRVIQCVNRFKDIVVK